MAKHGQVGLKLETSDHSMPQHNSQQSETGAAATPVSFTQPHYTFEQVLKIVEGIDGLTPGVSQNLQGAVMRCAKIMSSAGLRAVVA